eukprot:6182068-Pleurochrysis_carterae.AAC.2
MRRHAQLSLEAAHRLGRRARAHTADRRGGTEASNRRLTSFANAPPPSVAQRTRLLYLSSNMTKHGPQNLIVLAAEGPLLQLECE